MAAAANPNKPTEHALNWPAYNPSTGMVMELDIPFVVHSTPDTNRTECEFWKDFSGWY